jgi:hypothetical protein
MFLTVSAHTVIVKWTWYPTLANKARIIPDEGWPLGSLNALSRSVTCERGSSIACWFTHLLNYKLGGKSSANRYAFREKSYGCNRSSWKTSMILRCNSPNSHAISLHSCNYGIFNGWCSDGPWINLHSQASFLSRYTFCLTDTMLPSSSHISVWTTSATITVCTQWSFRDPTVHCALITANNALKPSW